jgi:hypothetical protein
MSNSNSYTNITSDGNVVTYDDHGVRILDFCGDLTMIHKILEVVKMPSKDKAKLPTKMRLRNTSFNFVREDISEIVPIPIQHISKFAEKIDKGNTKQFIEELLLQLPR